MAASPDAVAVALWRGLLRRVHAHAGTVPALPHDAAVGDAYDAPASAPTSPLAPTPGGGLSASAVPY
eukprot:gene6015-45674_t